MSRLIALREEGERLLRRRFDRQSGSPRNPELGSGINHHKKRGAAELPRSRFIRIFGLFRLFLEGLFDRDGDGDGGAHHRVVAHADEAHHLDVRRNRGGTRELSVGVHAAHGVGHAVTRRTGRHVIGVKSTAGAAARSDGEVLAAVLPAPLLVGAGDGMLEAGRVRGVARNGHAHVLELHDRDAFRNVVRTVATDVRTGALGERLLLDDLDLLGLRVEDGLAVGEAVDARDDVRGVLAETVQDDLKVGLTDLVRVEGDLDRAFSRGEGLVTREEREALGVVIEEHRAEVAVSAADLTVLGDGAGNAERLEADTDFRGGILRLRAALLDCHRSTDGVSPLRVLEAYRLGLFDDLVRIDTGLLADLGALFDGLDAVGLESGEDLRLTTLVTFEQLLGGLLGNFLGSHYKFPFFKH